VPGVETLFPLMLMAVKRNLLTLKKLIEVTSQNLPGYLISGKEPYYGYDADFIIVGDPKEIRREKMHSKAGWTPFNGMKGIFPE